MRVVILYVVLLVGCSDPVLEGPNYPAEGPPWIAADYRAEVAPLVVRERVILIGDAGLYLEGDPTLAALGRWSRPEWP